jgi:hypothetical protein
MSERKQYADYITGSFEPASSKWVSDHIVRGRRIALYGIRINFCTAKNGSVEMNPEIPCMGPMMEVIKKHPQEHEFVFDKRKRKWHAANQARAKVKDQ